MARTKKDAEREVWFKEPDKETKPIASMKNVPPQCQAEKIIMSSDENRHYMAGVLQRVSGFIRMKKVNSNKELMERIDDYFRYCIDEEVPPTWEGLGLYCGYSRKTLHQWSTGAVKGFPDTESGFTTQDIAQKAREILATLDATLVTTGKIPAIPYIFRGCNYYGLVNKQTVDIGTNTESEHPAMSREEIVKQLGIGGDDDDVHVE